MTVHPHDRAAYPGDGGTRVTVHPHDRAAYPGGGLRVTAHSHGGTVCSQETAA